MSSLIKGACAVKECVMEGEDESLAVDPCSHCGKPTHHICANSIHMDEDLSIRYCSMSCLHGKTRTQDESWSQLDDLGPTQLMAMMQSPINNMSATHKPGRIPSYIKIKKLPNAKKAFKDKKPRAKPTEEKHRQKRKSPLDELRKSYVGKEHWGYQAEDAFQRKKLILGAS